MNITPATKRRENIQHDTSCIMSHHIMIQSSRMPSVRNAMLHKHNMMYRVFANSVLGHLKAFECPKFFSNTSPYTVLDIKASATVQDIKQAFRKLVKQYHPDVNPDLEPTISQTKMAEIIEAYSQLMDGDYLLGAKIGSDSRVALAAEIYTIDELKLDRFHNVYNIRILYHDDDDDYHNERRMKQAKDEADDTDIRGSYYETQLSVETFIEVLAHPEDSVSDLKRAIQEKYETEWGLTGRRKDRDNICLGWELLCVNRTDEQELNSSKSSKKNQEHLVMSYHLFLSSYGIEHKDLIYAVVRKSGDH